MRHTHYVVQAYIDEDGLGNLGGVITLDLIADSEDSAISKAQKFASRRNWYKVVQVFEHDPDLEIATQASEPILQQLKDGKLTLDRIQILEATGEIKILPSLANIGGSNGRKN